MRENSITSTPSDDETRSSSFLYLTLVSIFAFCTVALLPMFRSDPWFESHDSERYLELVDGFVSAFLAGNIYPRWMTDLAGGYGYPTFVYYQPGYFYWCLPFALLISKTELAMKVSVFALVFQAGVGAYFLARQLSDRRTALFLALSFLFTPYLYTDLYVRGDLSELSGMMFTPWPLYFIFLLRRRIEAKRDWRWPVAGLSLALMMVIFAHPAVAMFYLPAFGICALYHFLATREKKAFATGVIVGGVTAALFSAPYWYGVYEMRPYSIFTKLIGGYNVPLRHTVYFRQLFDRAFDFGGSVMDSPNDEMPFQLGLPFFSLAVLGLLLNRRNHFQKTVFGIYVVLILLMTRVADPFWKLEGLPQYVQFPWRILAAIGIFQMCSMAGISQLSRNTATKGFYTPILVLFFVGISLWHSNMFAVIGSLQRRSTKAEIRNRFKTYANDNEFKPITVQEYPEAPRREDLMIRYERPVVARALPGATAHHIAYDVYTGLEEGEITLEQFYFPGWHVEVNGQKVSDEVLRKSLGPEGLIKLKLSPHEVHRVRAWYAGVPVLGPVKVLAALWLLVLAAFYAGFFGSTSESGRKENRVPEPLT